MALSSEKEWSFSLKFSERIADWLDLGHVLTHVVIRLNPVIGSSHLNPRVGVGVEANPPEEGKGGRQVKLLSLSEMSKKSC